ncbi:MAG: DUF1559 domain-containing protein [Armatimonadota bacterium]|nr:DUF1559 domain-containing protein [Armatimonadota bacterium]
MDAKRRNSTVKRGFTLIELLVVIAIIAILAAILFPVFARARENARKSSCQSNMKQIALGFKQYIGDFDERYPLVLVTLNTAGSGAPYGWADALQPYLRSSQIYQCPSELNTPNTNPSQNGYSDYWMNGWLNVKPSAVVLGINEAALSASALTILAGDGAGQAGTLPTGQPASDVEGTARYNQCGNAAGNTGAITGYSTGAGNTSGLCDPAASALVTAAANYLPAAQQHLEGANYAYADGHVKWLKGNSSTNSAAVTGAQSDQSASTVGRADRSNNKSTFAP